MSMTYTDRIKTMQTILGTIDQNNNNVKNLNDRLKELRKYSDVAEIIGHSKNPSKGVFTESTPQKERAMFNKFRNDLGDVQNKVISLVKEQKGVDIKTPLKEVFEEKKRIDELPLKFEPKKGLK